MPETPEKRKYPAHWKPLSAAMSHQNTRRWGWRRGVARRASAASTATTRFMVLPAAATERLIQSGASLVSQSK